jgi:phosphoribosylglycinamide formyltransferase-1
VRRLGILISGRGSNFQAIADAVRDGRLDADIAVVISNRDSAPGLQIARERGIHAVSLPSRGLDRTVYDGLLIDELQRHNVELVCLAGYLRLLSAEFHRGVSTTDREHPPFSSAGVSGIRCAAPSAGSWCQSDWMHGAFR